MTAPRRDQKGKRERGGKYPPRGVHGQPHGRLVLRRDRDDASRAPGAGSHEQRSENGAHVHARARHFLVVLVVLAVVAVLVAAAFLGTAFDGAAAFGGAAAFVAGATVALAGAAATVFLEGGDGGGPLIAIIGVFAYSMR